MKTAENLNSDALLKAILPNLESKYEYKKKLGGGLFSNTYLLHHKHLQEDHVLEIIDADFILRILTKAQDEDPTREFEKIQKKYIEAAHKFGKIHHPNVAEIYDIDVVKQKTHGVEIPFITMQHIEGELLSTLLKKKWFAGRGKDPVNWERVNSISADILGAIDAMHTRSIVHMNIRPDNIKIEKKSGKAVLVDFGIPANPLINSEMSSQPGFSDIAIYMSPEQFVEGDNVGKETDLYSFGIILFEMLTGAPPFKGNLAEIMTSHFQAPVPGIRKIVPGLPEGIDEILSKALAKKPSQRYRTSWQIAEALQVTIPGSSKFITADSYSPRPLRFHTAGLCFPGKHYMVDPLKRLKDVEGLIEEELYFTLHAPRQTGKTTYLHAMARKLNAEGKYISVAASCERAGYRGITVREANEVIIDSIYSAATLQLPGKHRPENPRNNAHTDLKIYLETWSLNQQKPIVLFLDEIDSLYDNVLISVLRQLRDGYQSRPSHFPSSIVLVGLRDVREYKAAIREGQESMGTASPFNIKSDSLVLKNFLKQDVYSLLEQHTDATGQVFPEEVKAGIYRLSGGQPWLTNALARQIVSKILGGDYSKPITGEILFQAKQQLILRRDTHLDSLVDKLKEDRVKRIVQAIINGDNIAFDILDDDIAYVRDLGIVAQSSPLKFANPIYAEIVPRIMASPMQEFIPGDIQQPWFLDEQGKLDVDKLIKEFQNFYRRNSEAWLKRYEYKESAHHLLFMAFLQRIINAGGDIVREMAVGNGRIDLLVKFKKQEFAFELKIKRDNSTIEDGKKQLCRYLDGLGLQEGYLVIFDPGDKEWGEKLYLKKIDYEGKKIILVGL
ncbi:MAG: protein kinase [Candidatus Aminicenantes bacterium]|nr:protein kinase [Candidatus Aminicenantes bacterium]